MDEELIPVVPYRKSKGSSVSKASKKTKHKHDYEDCLIHTKRGSYLGGRQCRSCGVQHITKWLFTAPVPNSNMRRFVSDYEIPKLYPDLPIYESTIEDY